MNQKHIILSLAIFFVISTLYLAYTEKSQHNLEGQWFIYFQNPKDQSLDFSIENHSKKSQFEWKLICGENTLRKEYIEVHTNDIEQIEISEPCDQKSSIQVSCEKDTLELYKFPNLR